MRGLERRRAAGECKRVGGKYRVACAGDVNSLIASVDGDLRQAASGFEERHAMAPARNEKGAEFHFGECGSAAARQLGKILADGNVMQGFQLRFVGSGRCDASLGVGVKVVARIQRDGWGVFLFRKSLADQAGAATPKP